MNYTVAQLKNKGYSIYQGFSGKWYARTEWSLSPGYESKDQAIESANSSESGNDWV